MGPVMEADDSRAFPCTVPGCGKAYRRNEHLVRHLRSHRLQKPFDCPECHRNYGRQDVLKRHIASQHSSARHARGISRRQPRALSACDRCHVRKAGCGGELPCQPCLKSNAVCQYSRKVPEPSHAPATTPDELVDASIWDCPSPPEAALEDTGSPQGHVDSVASADSGVHTPNALDQAAHPNSAESFGPLPAIDPNTALQSMVDSHQPWAGPSTTLHLPSGAAEMKAASTDEISLLHADPSGLDDNSTTIDCIERLSRDEWPADALGFNVDMPDLDSILESALCGPAFSLTCPDMWLRAPSGIFNSTVPLPATPSGHDLLQPYDSAAWTVANVSHSGERPDAETTARPASLFPLDSHALKVCLDTFFAKFHRLWPAVHRSTFNPESENADLVDSMAMIGAWESRIGPWKDVALHLHKSIMEKLQKKLFDFSSDDEVMRRWPVSTYQTLLLNVIFALQSSHDKLFNKAYLQHSMMLSVFHTAGLFREQYSLGRDDPKEAIPSSWVTRESLKRLAYLAFRLDIYFYFLCGFHPTLRYDELCLTLPCSERLWEAQTAEEWHRVKLIESRVRRPTPFLDLVEQAMDPERRASLPPLLEDEYLYGLCAMQAWLWQDAQRQRTQTELGQPLSGSHLTARGAEFWENQLTIWRQGYRDKSIGPTLSSRSHRQMVETSAIPLYHLSQVVLRANLEAIKELSMDPRRRPYSGTFRRQLESNTLKWVKTTDARLAIWHAAQVLKLLQEKIDQGDGEGDLACAIPNVGLIASIALYESGLVVWAYARSVQVCDACAIGSTLQARSVDLEPFELYSSDQHDSFRLWLEHGGRELIGGYTICVCRLSTLVGMYESVLLQCGSQWRCVSQMADSLSRLKQGDE
ncbi:fungal-specific transcription factor domain-containing protein [Ilyonectria destructans]|nr:fungal-specific transcription factor domain-containing protein [Ilyonectria destructans]